MMFTRKNLALFCMATTLAIFFLKGSAIATENNARRSRVCFKERCFAVEVVSAPKEREQGLMFRTQLGADEGMLFVFEREGTYPFWMKNMSIPLDILWIDKEKRIAGIKKNVMPCVNDDCPLILGVEKRALYVLELNAGTSDQIGLGVGHTLQFVIQ